MTRRLTHQRVARWLWEKDGKPDGYAVGEANKELYWREAEEIFEAIRTLGYAIVPAAKEKK